MKIFVSGATGHVGSHLVKKLAESGHTVHALVRSAEKAKSIQFENVVLFEGDITNLASVDTAMAGCDQVYHLAAMAKVWSKNSGDFYTANVGGTVHVLESALKHKVDRVVFTSSAGVLGPSIKGVVTESKIRDLDFFNEYEGSKSMAEAKVSEYIIVHGMDIVTVSPTRIYGPFLFGTPQAATLLIDKYVNGKWRIYPGTGKEIGNYIFIDDVIAGHILAMEKGEKGHNYILGGENHSYISLYEKLGTIAGIQRKMIRLPLWIQVRFAKIQLFLADRFGKEPMITPKWIAKAKFHWEVSPQKAVDELNVPVTPFDEGLKQTIAHLRHEK